MLKDGELVAERYWRLGRPDYQQNVQSVTKRYTGALVALAIEDGRIPSVDEPMMTYFPELEARVGDPRTNDITIEHLLQMRAGYAWEESYAEGVELFYTGFRPSSLLQVPLVRDPGTGGDYSNLSSHLLAIIVSRACETDLLDLAQEKLFDPLDTSVSDWMVGLRGLSARLRRVVRLGHGHGPLRSDVPRRRRRRRRAGGARLVDRRLLAALLRGHVVLQGRGRFDRTAHGYQWWTIDAGPHAYYLAWGHGGQQIAVLPEFDMVVILAADPLYHESGDRAWGLEKANLNLVASFIAGLPGA